MTKRYVDYAVIRTMEICCDTCHNCLRNTEDMFLCKVDFEKCLGENYLLWTFPVGRFKNHSRIKLIGFREEEE